MRNPILKTDSYKLSHFNQLPPETTSIKSYVTARGSKVPGVDAVVCAGLQIFIQEHLRQQVTHAHIDHAEVFCKKHGVPFNREGWEIIVNEHGGYLPVEIRAVEEGTPVPFNEMMISVTNLDERLPWITSYIETLLLSHVWYASSVATLSREIKKVIKEFLDETSDSPDAELPFKLHDFGYRGAAPGAAGVGAWAHLINFYGTDTIAGIETAMEYYSSDVCGFSIPASEHSTITSWTRDAEYAAYANMVKQYAKPGAIFACVIDSYDTLAAIKMWTEPYPNGKGTPSLLDQVKEAGATVVLRPDSGDPVQMPIDVINMVANDVGYKKNSKGYDVLPDHVRVIQGDGIDIDDVRKILKRMKDNKLSASNITFGMGGGLLQKVNRDTFKFAMKACKAVVNGKDVNVVKDPVTDPGKRSKAGDLALFRSQTTGKMKTFDLNEMCFFNDWRRIDHVVYSHYLNRTTHVRVDMETVRKNAAL